MTCVSVPCIVCRLYPHSVQAIPCESAVGDEGIGDVYESIILNAVMSEVEGGEGRVGLE